jgi:hypothetical protein
MTAMDANTTNMPSINAVETPLPMGSEKVCENPLCQVRFLPAGMAISPKKFCSESCRMNAWILKRAATLLAGIPDQDALEIMRGQR